MLQTQNYTIGTLISQYFYSTKNIKKWKVGPTVLPQYKQNFAVGERRVLH